MKREKIHLSLKFCQLFFNPFRISFDELEMHDGRSSDSTKWPSPVVCSAQCRVIGFRPGSAVLAGVTARTRRNGHEPENSIREPVRSNWLFEFRSPTTIHHRGVIMHGRFN